MEVKVGSPYCENKTALHFPSEMMESALWIKICQLTNQPVKRASSKLYSLVMSSLFQELIPFCNSAEAPSGVAVTQSESNLESTRSGDQRHPRMVLEESSIGSKESSAPTDQTAEETFDEDGTKEDIEEEDEEEESGESVDDETLGGDEEEESLDVVVEDEQEEDSFFVRPAKKVLKRLSVTTNTTKSRAALKPTISFTTSKSLSLAASQLTNNSSQATQVFRL